MKIVAADRVLPEGVTLTETGEAEFMRESFSQFGLMLFLAVLAVYGLGRRFYDR